MLLSLVQKPRNRPLIFHVSEIEDDWEIRKAHQIPTWVNTSLQLRGSAIVAYYRIDQATATAVINRALDYT